MSPARNKIVHVSEQGFEFAKMFTRGRVDDDRLISIGRLDSPHAESVPFESLPCLGRTQVHVKLVIGGMGQRNWLPAPFYTSKGSAKTDSERTWKIIATFSTIDDARGNRLHNNKGQPYGSENWVKRRAKRLGLESTLRRRGRPRKQPQRN